MNKKLIILTGEQGSGKTTLLQQFCSQQDNVHGVLSPVINGKRMFYDIAGKIFIPMETQAGEKHVAVGKYLFDPAAFEKANQIIQHAANNEGTTYLIIDEIGPLEMNQQLGLFPSLENILASPFIFTLILVVRPSLIAAVMQMHNAKDAVVLNLCQAKTILIEQPNIN